MRAQIRRYILSLIFFLIITFIPTYIFADVVYTSRPLIYNFGTSTYLAANQNWSISQAPDGVLYFANSGGLLSYNGVEWQLNKLPNPTIVRSVFADKDGRIYTGAHNEFGYWQKNAFGVLHYYSLRKLFPKEFNQRGEDIWNIKRIGNNIYFHSFARLYIYNGKRIISIHPQVISYSLISHKNSPYIVMNSNILYRIMPNGTLRKVLQLPLQCYVVNAVDIDSRHYLLFTDQKVFEITDEKNISVWKTSIDSNLQSTNINRVVQKRDGSIIIGTVNDGIYIIDKNGKLIQHYDRDSGLQNNTILGVFLDKKENLWIGLDKGIDYMDFSSPYLFFNSKNNSIGAVYCAKLYQGNLYVGTNTGLYSGKFSYKNKNLIINFKLLRQGQVWNLKIFNNHLMCGHNDGLFLVEKDKMTSISAWGGCIGLIWNPYNNTIFQSGYMGFSILKMDNDHIYTLKQQNFPYVIRTIELDYNYNLWITGMYGGLWRVKMNESMDSVIKIEKVGGYGSSFSNSLAGVYKYGNSVFFLNGRHVYSYDNIHRELAFDDNLNRDLGEYANAYNCFNTSPSEIWLAKKDRLAHFVYSNDRFIKKEEFRYDLYGCSSVDDYENISSLFPNLYLIGCDEGFVLYDSRLNNQNFKGKYFPFVYRVESYNKKEEVQLVPITGRNINVAHSHNKLHIYITSSGLLKSPVKYFYRLSSKDNWILVNGNMIQLADLSTGKYKLQVKLVELMNNSETINTYSFRVLPPWYLTFYAFLIYLTLFLGIIYSIRYIFKKRMRKQKYEYIKQLRHIETLQFEMRQKKLLNDQIENNSQKLAQFAIFLQKKNDTLQQIKEYVESPSSIDSMHKQRLISMVNQGLSNHNEWMFFQVHFDNTNKNFMQNLKEAYPELTSNDIRFCAYLRLNLSSKDISELFNISLRSIEVKRYRIRKKLNLDHEASLTDFLSKF